MLTQTDISDRADVTVLINADENTVVWYTLYSQQFLQHHIASYNTNRTFSQVYLTLRS